MKEKMKKTKIVCTIGPASESPKMLKKLVLAGMNYISWDDREPVYDIRTWNEDHTAYGKGVTVTAGEMVVLKELLQSRNVF